MHCACRNFSMCPRSAHRNRSSHRTPFAWLQIGEVLLREAEDDMQLDGEDPQVCPLALRCCSCAAAS